MDNYSRAKQKTGKLQVRQQDLFKVRTKTWPDGSVHLGPEAETHKISPTFYLSLYKPVSLSAQEITPRIELPWRTQYSLDTVMC